jgi:energy-coupling factor transporter ATP-binding protein EcfA2
VSKELLRFESVSYRYPGGARTALESIDLEVRESEFVVLGGASGSGKSALLRAASGLVPHFYGGKFQGEVVVGGLNTREHGPGQIATVAASLFQDPESQAVMTTAGAELALPLENRGQPPATVARAVEETAISLGIADLLERPLDTLSGGELQRVALGAALATQPRVLLLDEPTSQLDPVAGDELIWQLRRLNEEWGTAVLLAEHRLERCLAAADRVVVLDHGRVVCDSSPVAFAQWAASGAGELAPPVTRMFSLAGARPLPVGVKDGRRLLEHWKLPAAAAVTEQSARRRRWPRRAGGRRGQPGALELRGVWVSYEDGSAAGRPALRGLSMTLEPGKRVALVGRNGAGKSTLLRLAAGLQAPERGRVWRAGEMALLLQNPGDYFLHERVGEELPSEYRQEALRAVGLAEKADCDPHDLSGGERQRLALAIVLAGRGIGGGRPPSVVALDEPTRGMDRGHKLWLSRLLGELAGAGAAVIVATHDVEFAARLADRAVLLARGRIVADGPTRDVFSGGRYFATEVARLLAPVTGIVLPEEGARLLRSPGSSDEEAGVEISTDVAAAAEKHQAERGALAS